MRVFWVYVPLVLAALVWNLSTPLVLWAVCLAAGLTLWTAVEYLMHRWVLHRLAPHYQHHDEPEVVAYIFAPLALSAGSAAVLWPLLSLATGSWRLGALTMAGTVIGYLAYEWLHVRMHRPIAGGRILRALRKHHFYHHFADDSRCYGVTSPIWDAVFRTGAQRRASGYDGPTKADGRADLDIRAARKSPQRG